MDVFVGVAVATRLLPAAWILSEAQGIPIKHRNSGLGAVIKAE